MACRERCNVRTVLRHSGRRLGRSEKLRIRDDRRHTLTVRLNRDIRRNLLAAMRQSGTRSLKATAVTKVRTADDKRTIRRRVVLRR